MKSPGVYLEPKGSDDSNPFNNNGDLSLEATSLGRTLDRLAPGDYVIQLSINLRRDGGWTADISRSETIRTGKVGKHEQTDKIES